MPALLAALDGLGWRCDLRVDGSERVERVVLADVHAGSERRVRARDGYSSLGAPGALGHDLLADVVDGMEAQLQPNAAAASVGSRATYARWAVAGVVAASAYYFI